MKYVDEYRDRRLADVLIRKIHSRITQAWTLMEVCGGQTHGLLRFGIPEQLPKQLRLIHGPGCPVCVTPLEQIDRALAIACLPEVIFCSFGDMLRVPGSRTDLMRVRAAGGDVRMVYSPLDAVRLASMHPEKQVVFFAVGFETTAPATALAVWQAHEMDLHNFSMLVAHVLVPPAMEAILQSPHNQVQAFLAAGHVCTVMGFEDYDRLAAHFHVPIVVTGFEPIDLLEGIYRAVCQLEAGKANVENQYARSVRRQGNIQARGYVEQVYEVSDQAWRGLGIIPRSGLKLKGAFSFYDAERRFQVSELKTIEPEECRSGEVLQGRLRPDECEAFGSRCTPDHPLGAPMVSSEGACAAYWQFRRYAAIGSESLK